MKNPGRALIAIALSFIILLSCTRSDRSPAADALATVPMAVPTAVTPTSAVITSQARANCVDGATFLQDLSVPDGSQLAPGAPVDKRWSVLNSGTCDWGLGYRLIPQDPNPLVSGFESALYPAKAGANAVWRVTFEAPEQPGEYIGSWQAFNPQGQPFGDPVFILIRVEPETIPE